MLTLLAVMTQLVCIAPLTTSVSPSRFDNVEPGAVVTAGILVENKNPTGCPDVTIVVHAESAPPKSWLMAIDGGSNWIVSPGAKAFTNLKAIVPSDTMTGSYQINLSINPVRVINLIVNVKAKN